MSIRRIRSFFCLLLACLIAGWFFGCSGSIDQADNLSSPILGNISSVVLTPPGPPPMLPATARWSNEDNHAPAALIDGLGWTVPFPRPREWYSFGTPFAVTEGLDGLPQPEISRLWWWDHSVGNVLGSWQSIATDDPDLLGYVAAGRGYFYFSGESAAHQLELTGIAPDPITEYVLTLSGRGWHLVTFPLGSPHLFQSIDVSSRGVRVMLPDALTRAGSDLFPYLYLYGFRYADRVRGYLAIDLEADQIEPGAAYWLYSFQDTLLLHLPPSSD